MTSQARRASRPLARVSAALGLWPWLPTGAAPLFIAAAMMFAIVPFTLLIIKPLNDRMLAVATEQAGAAERAMLIRWGGLHWVRNLLALGAVAAYATWLAAG